MRKHILEMDSQLACSVGDKQRTFLTRSCINTIKSSQDCVKSLHSNISTICHICVLARLDLRLR